MDGQFCDFFFSFSLLIVNFLFLCGNLYTYLIGPKTDELDPRFLISVDFCQFTINFSVIPFNFSVTFKPSTRYVKIFSYFSPQMHLLEYVSCWILYRCYEIMKISYWDEKLKTIKMSSCASQMRPTYPKIWINY